MTPHCSLRRERNTSVRSRPASPTLRRHRASRDRFCVLSSPDPTSPFTTEHASVDAGAGRLPCHEPSHGRLSDRGDRLDPVPVKLRSAPGGMFSACRWPHETAVIPPVPLISGSRHGQTQWGAFRLGARRSRGDCGGEVGHLRLAWTWGSDARRSPRRVGPRRSRLSCPRGSHLRSVRQRLALGAPRRARAFAVRGHVLPRSAAQPRCRPLARTAHSRATPCRCRWLAYRLLRACTYCSEHVFDWAP
jgi:hypothetical protein